MFRVKHAPFGCASIDPGSAVEGGGGRFRKVVHRRSSRRGTSPRLAARRRDGRQPEPIRLLAPRPAPPDQREALQFGPTAVRMRAVSGDAFGSSSAAGTVRMFEELAVLPMATGIIARLA